MVQMQPAWLRLLIMTMALGLLLGACAPADEEEEVAPPDPDVEEEEDEEEDDAPAEPEEQVTLRLLAGVPESYEPGVIGFQMLAEKVAEKSDGSLTIEWAGGPDVIPPFEMGEAMGTGAFDIHMASSAYYQPQLAAASVVRFSEITPEEERENGALDRLNELHEEQLGVHLLGRAQLNQPFVFYTVDPVQETADFSGLRIRTSPGYIPLTDRLGMEAVNIPGGELYTALERGVVDGITWPDVGVTAAGVEDLLNYKITPSWWAVDVLFLVELPVWESLSERHREILMEAQLELDAELGAVSQQLKDEEAEVLEAAGMETIELADGDHLLELSREAARAWMAEHVQPPELAEELLELFGVDAG